MLDLSGPAWRAMFITLIWPATYHRKGQVAKGGRVGARRNGGHRRGEQQGACCTKQGCREGTARRLGGWRLLLFPVRALVLCAQWRAGCLHRGRSHGLWMMGRGRGGARAGAGVGGWGARGVGYGVCVRACAWADHGKKRKRSRWGGCKPCV